MGKTRTKLIDDSVKESQEKKAPKKEQDSLVAKLQEELGITPKGAKVDVTQPADTSEVRKVEKQAQPSKRSKKTQKPGEPTKIRSKKYREAVKDLDRSRTYPLPEALDTIKKMSYSKFDGTLEVHISTAQTGIRGLVSLPYAAGKKIRILAFPSTSFKVNSKNLEPEYEGVVFGNDSTLQDIEKGKIDFDLIVTTPEWMPKLAKVAKILGPKGLMPNPKNGTITDDLKKTVEGFQGGKTEYKTESKTPVIHLGLGKLNQPNEELEANLKTLLQTIGKTRVKKVTLSPTMGPGVKLDLTSI